MIQFACSCGRKVTAPDDAAGRRAKCPACGAVNVVPDPAVAVADEPDVPLALAPTPAPAQVAATPPPRSRGRAWLRGLLVTIAILDGLWILSTPLRLFALTGHETQMRLARARGEAGTVLRLERERDRYLDDLWASNGTAWIALAVALAGLAASPLDPSRR